MQVSLRKSAPSACARPCHDWHSRPAAARARRPQPFGQRSSQQLKNYGPHRAVATTYTEAQPSSLVAEEPKAGLPEPLNWYKQWYPVAIVKDLDPQRPTAVALLGLDLVLWRDGTGQWQCFEDKCPHRLAPLSEGRIDKDANGVTTLMCSYHGWTFDAAGACTRIPQVGDPNLQSRALTNPRSCVRSYPTRQEEGLIWVWAEAGPAAAAEAAGAAVPMMAEMRAGMEERLEWVDSTDWFMRDVPVSMDTVIENVFDPCHANFTHHKVQGRRSAETGSSITPLSAPSINGFSCLHEGSGGRLKAEMGLQPPCLVKYVFNKSMAMAVYAVPSKAGWTRMITKFGKKKNNTAKVPLMFKIFGLLQKVRLLEHTLVRNKVLDGDNYILHIQERALLKAGNKAGDTRGSGNWRSAFFTPGTSDTAVASWRSWLERFGRAMPILPHSLEDLPPQMPREQALDRYSQHVVHCSTCQQALQRTDTALPLLTALGRAAAAVAAYLVLGRGLAWASAPVLGCAALALVAWGVHSFLTGFRKQFFFMDYVHAHIE